MLLPESANTQSLIKRTIYYTYDDYSSWWKWRWLLWILILIPVFVTIFVISRRARKNKVVAYNNPDPQANQTYYYNNNQYQGEYNGNNDLPPQATPGYIPPAYLETSQQQGYNPQQLGNYNSGEISKPEDPPPAHTKAQ